MMAVQATTTKRSGITLGQNFFWLFTYEDYLNDIRRINICFCRFSGNKFGELIQHFISGGNETCFVACEYGTIKMIGTAGRKQNEKRTQDSRISITLNSTGSVAGDTGPSIFLMAGKKQLPGYTGFFLNGNGAAEGMTIIMTDTVYIKTEA